MTETEHAPIYLPYTTSWIVSGDLGQSQDPTALAVAEITPRRHKLTLDDFDPHTGRRKIDTQWKETTRNETPERIDVRHLERLPLGMSYVEQAVRVRTLMQTGVLRGAPLVLDATGVGRAVIEIFQHAGLTPISVTITAGHDERKGDKPDEWFVPKLALVSRVQSVLHSGELHIAPALPEAKTLVDELQNFRGTFNDATGYTSFNARVGQHDDLVLSLALLCWQAFRPKPAQWGTSTHRGLYGGGF